MYNTALTRPDTLSGLLLMTIWLATTAHAEPITTALTLTNIQQITDDGRSIAPRFSPTDNNLIAYTQPKYRGIYLKQPFAKDGLRALSTQPPAELSDDAHVGFQFSWSGDGQTIVGRFSEDGVQQQAGKIDVKTGEYAALSDSAMHVSVPVVSGDTVGFMENDTGKQVVLPPPPGTLRFFSRTTPAPSIQEKDGQIRVNTQLVNPESTQCWLPIISPDEQKVVFECWEGMFVYHIPQQTRYPLGKGSSPSWASDSERLVYEVTLDEGHIVIQSDIYLIRYDGTHKQNLTADSYLIARRPSLSADGKQMAFDSYGDIYIADVAGVAQ